MAKEYLDKTGLAYFWGKIKSYLNDFVVASSDESGSVVTFDKVRTDTNLKSVVATILPVQDLSQGNPTPSNVKPITGFTEVKIYVSPTTNTADATVYTVSLSSAGTVYGGTLDVTSGRLIVDRGIADVGTDLTSYGYDSTNKVFVATLSDIKQPAVTGLAPEILCSAYTPRNTGYQIATYADGSIWQNPSVSGRVVIKDLRYTNANDFRSAATGVKLVYPLATPLTYTVTPTQISTLSGLGTNNVWADCGNVSIQIRTSEMLSADILDTIYPVGTYYETSDTAFNPGTAWGGTWSLDSSSPERWHRTA